MAHIAVVARIHDHFARSLARLWRCARKKGRHLVVLVLRPLFIGVVVAAGAGDADAQKDFARGFGQFLRAFAAR